MDRGQKKIIGINIRMLEETPSGIQNFISCLFREMSRRDIRYKYLFLSTGNNRIENVPFKDQYLKSDSLLMNLFEKIDHRLANIFFDNLYILKLIKDFQIKFFVSPSYILPIFKPKDVKFITVIHDLSFLKYKHNPLRIYMNLVMYMKIMMPGVLKRADLIIVPSSFVKKELEKIYHTDPLKIKIIYEGRDTFFHPVQDKKEFLKIQRKFKIENKYLFTIATNHERKNLLGLIKAFSVLKNRKDLQLVICGLLPDFAVENLKKEIKALNLEKEIKFLGFVSRDELRVLYSKALLFVFPSFEEGFGLPILESVSCGCLPVCSNTGSLPEVIGNRDLLFDPYNFKAMKNKIDEVLSWSKEKSAWHFKLVENHTGKFSWEKCAAQYLEIFNSFS